MYSTNTGAEAEITCNPSLAFKGKNINSPAAKVAIPSPEVAFSIVTRFSVALPFEANTPVCFKNIYVTTACVAAISSVPPLVAAAILDKSV